MIDKTLKKNRLKTDKVETLVCLKKNIKCIDVEEEEGSEFCFDSLMLRTHEELLPFVSIDETWKETGGGIEANESDKKRFSGCHGKAVKDVKKLEKTLK